jgi:beta-galactosidase
VAHVTFEIVDSTGTVVPAADHEVRFAASGGTILAPDNGDLQDHAPYQSDRRRAFNGAGLAILRASKAGLLRLTASAAGLAMASVTVQVVQGRAPETVPAAQ